MDLLRELAPLVGATRLLLAVALVRIETATVELAVALHVLVLGHSWIEVWREGVTSGGKGRLGDAEVCRRGGSCVEPGREQAGVIYGRLVGASSGFIVRSCCAMAGYMLKCAIDERISWITRY